MLQPAGMAPVGEQAPEGQGGMKRRWWATALIADGAGDEECRGEAADAERLAVLRDEFTQA